MGLYLQVRGATMTGAPSRPQRQVRLTLRGLARKHQFNPGATRAARADLKEAIRRDPNYVTRITRPPVLISPGQI